MADWRSPSAYVMILTFRTEDGNWLEHMRMSENRYRLERYGISWSNGYMAKYPDGRVEMQVYDMETGLRVTYEQRHSPA